MRRDYYANSKDYINRWVVSYADFVTMLLALFMVLWALSASSNNISNDFTAAVKKTMGVKDVKNVNISQENPSVQEQIPVADNKAEILVAQGNSILSGHDKIIELIKNDVSLNQTLNILKDPRGVIIRLNDMMFFEPGSAIIKSEAIALLDGIAMSLKKLDNPILIEGHTDSTPINTEKFPSNWELSTARATNIIDYLINKHDLSPKRLSAVGYGQFMPIASNETSTQRAQNRRVDIIILSEN